jgi:hypothetical protein
MKIIKLTQDKECIVDDSDFARLSKMQWHVVNFHGKFYAYITIDGRNRPMHRYIMRPRKGRVVDHINGNTLDNRRCNLRSCTHQNNICNSKLYRNNKSGFRGVFKHGENRFTAQVTSCGKTLYIGMFKNALDAAVAYDKVALEVHEDFGSTNKGLGLI